ncbi:hypothetical protein DAI22_12g192875 [Oryza sativa Japonica Group]|nr:hypothetical protein DAI22_12g192875 [Oryza sativa Japonica Group]
MTLVQFMVETGKVGCRCSCLWIPSEQEIKLATIAEHISKISQPNGVVTTPSSLGQLRTYEQEHVGFYGMLRRHQEFFCYSCTVLQCQVLN